MKALIPFIGVRACSVPRMEVMGSGSPTGAISQCFSLYLTIIRRGSDQDRHCRFDSGNRMRSGSFSIVRRFSPPVFTFRAGTVVLIWSLQLRRWLNPVWYFEFEPLEFVCYLGFVIWYFQYFEVHYFITLSEPEASTPLTVINLLSLMHARQPGRLNRALWYDTCSGITITV